MVLKGNRQGPHGSRSTLGRGRSHAAYAWRCLAAVLAVSVAAVACGDDDDSAASVGADTAANTTASADSTAAVTSAPTPTSGTSAREPAAPAAAAGADAECPAGWAPAPAASSELTEVRVATIPVVDFAPIFYAATCGYFAAEGLDVALESVQGGAIGAQLLTAGDVQFTITNWPGFAQAAANGAPLAGIATGTVTTPDTNYVFVRADSDIDEPAELVGRTLGTNTTGSVGDISTTAVLRSVGIEGDPQWVVTPLPEIIPAIQSGALDGGHLAEPFVSAARAAGLKPVLDVFSGPMQELPLSGYATLQSIVAEQPEMVGAFQAAMEASTNSITTDEVALRAFVLTYATIPPEVAPHIVLPVWRDRFAPDDVQRMVDVVHDSGFLPQPLDIAPLLVTT